MKCKFGHAVLEEMSFNNSFSGLLAILFSGVEPDGKLNMITFCVKLF